MGDAVLLRQNAGNDIHFIYGGDCYQQIAAPCLAPHKRRAGAVSQNGEYIQIIPHGLQLIAVRIHHHHVVAFIGQKLCNDITQMAGANHNNAHIHTPLLEIHTCSLVPIVPRWG